MLWSLYLVVAVSNLVNCLKPASEACKVQSTRHKVQAEPLDDFQPTKKVSNLDRCILVRIGTMGRVLAD